MNDKKRICVVHIKMARGKYTGGRLRISCRAKFDAITPKSKKELLEEVKKIVERCNFKVKKITYPDVAYNYDIELYHGIDILRTISKNWSTTGL